MAGATLAVAPDVHGQLTHPAGAGVSVRSVGDIRDPDHAERLEATAPDAYYRRREFLQRTAVAAGLAGGLRPLLPAETLGAEAAREERRAKPPSPRNMPLDTLVRPIMENRAFGHQPRRVPG